MKMNYQPRNKRGSRYGTAIKVAIAVIVVLVIFSFVAPRALSGFFSALFSPLWRVTASFYSSENMALTQQIEAHGADTIALMLLEQENAELKTILGRTPSKNSTLAVVLKKPPLAPYDTMIIDIGAEHAVAVGDMVYAVSPDALPTSTASVSTSAQTIATTSTTTASSTASSTVPATFATLAPIGSATSFVKVPVGLISEVTGNTSKVDLFSSPGKKYNVEIGKNHTAVTATGRGAGTFEATLPREANVAVGDIVIIPSIEPLVFATVTGLVSDAARPFATVIFQSPVNIFSLHWVEVDTKSADVKAPTTKVDSKK